MLELQNIAKYYQGGTVNETCLFKDFSLTIPDRQFVCVIGSNGSGKTSMLNIICGSIPIDGGKVLVSGRDVTALPEHQASPHHRPGVSESGVGHLPSMTILENMSMADNKGKPFDLHRCVNRKKTDEYREMLAQLGLGLEDKMGVQVGNLSGGQRQAMALLMSTMTPIEFLILDEHTAALDPKTADIIMRLTDRIVKEKKLTTLMVTHNLRYALEYGDRLLMLHEGKAVLDRAGQEKQDTQLDEVLKLFNEISVECGN